MTQFASTLKFLALCGLLLPSSMQASDPTPSLPKPTPIVLRPAHSNQRPSIPVKTMIVCLVSETQLEFALPPIITSATVEVIQGQNVLLYDVITPQHSVTQRPSATSFDIVCTASDGRVFSSHYSDDVTETQ